jgi:hypothetical protein
MTSYTIASLPTHAELDHDTRGWERGDIRPIVGWMFVSTADIGAALYPVIDPKPPHTVQAVLYDDWWPAEAPQEQLDMVTIEVPRSWAAYGAGTDVGGFPADENVREACRAAVGEDRLVNPQPWPEHILADMERLGEIDAGTARQVRALRNPPKESS